MVKGSTARFRGVIFAQAPGFGGEWRLGGFLSPGELAAILDAAHWQSDPSPILVVEAGRETVRLGFSEA
jgi:hypothetical protein